MTPLAPIRVRSIRDSVGERVREALREGRLQPGEDLNEVNLARQLNVSRGPVREALLILTQEGLLTYSQNRGFSVLRFTREDRAAVDEVRMLLEPRALELARERVTEADLERLEELERRLEQALLTDPMATRDAVEMAFHGLIWEISGNQWLARSLKQAMLPYFTYCGPLRDPSMQASPETLVGRHQLYLDYLRGKAGMDAQECVRQHLGKSV